MAKSLRLFDSWMFYKKKNNKMKKVISMVMLLLATGSAMAADLWNGVSSDKSWYDGSKDELYVYTAAQLKGLADLVNNDSVTFEGKTIYLMDDLDMGYNEWTPIGNRRWSPRTFMGTFDGCDHQIARLMVRSRESDNYYNLGYGFFGSVKEAEVRNLRLAIDILFQETSYSGSYLAGGLVASGSCNAKRIFADVNIQIYSDVNAQGLECGGVFGSVAGNLEEVSLKGAFTQYSQSWFPSLYIGSLARSCQSVQRCQSSFDINVRDVSQPFVAGLAYSCNSIFDAIYTGSISTNTYYQNGGFLYGIAAFADETLQNCIFAPTSLSLNGGVYQYPVAIGGGEKVLNCYYLSNYTYMNDGKGIPITQEQLQSGNAMSGFDTSVWEFNAGHYPGLIALKQLYDIFVPTTNGKISFRVKEGDAATIKVQADKDWRVLTVLLDGVDITSSLLNGSYTIEAVNENHEISVVYEQINSGVREAVTRQEPLVRIVDGHCVEIGNVVAGSCASLYDMDGKLLFSKRVRQGEILNLERGVYIMKVGGRSYKFAI